jgi:hypothetical protein
MVSVDVYARINPPHAPHAYAPTARKRRSLFRVHVMPDFFPPFPAVEPCVALAGGAAGFLLPLVVAGVAAAPAPPPRRVLLAAGAGAATGVPSACVVDFRVRPGIVFTAPVGVIWWARV